MTDLLQEFATATEGLFAPRPQSAEQVNARLMLLGFKRVSRAAVPDLNLLGFESLAYFPEDDTVLMGWPEGRA